MPERTYRDTDPEIHPEDFLTPELEDLAVLVARAMCRHPDRHVEDEMPSWIALAFDAQVGAVCFTLDDLPGLRVGLRQP